MGVRKLRGGKLTHGRRTVNLMSLERARNLIPRLEEVPVPGCDLVGFLSILQPDVDWMSGRGAAN